MDGDDIARVVYLTIILGSVAGWALVEARGRMGQAARQALAWVLIALGLAGGYGLYQDLSFDDQRIMAGTEGQQLVLNRNADSHYYLTLKVDGTQVRFMVDTGASSIVLSDNDVKRLGINRASLAFTGTAHTANGTIRTAAVTLRNVVLEGKPIGDLRASVGDGPLGVSLLGMEFLNRFTRVEIAKDRLILTR